MNNLGWVNKNFFSKTQAGDEFGIVIESQDPQVIQKVMKDLQTEIHSQAHSVFREETQRRAAAFRVVYQRYKNNEITEAEYQAAYLDFKTYTSYSQEGVSMGAAYIDGTSAEAIQNRAEKMATEMKIKIKQAFNLDTSKYTGGVNLSNADQNIKSRFRADIPSLGSLSPQNLNEGPRTPTDSLQLQKRETWFASIPVIKSQRTSDVLRYGKIGIGKYKNELTTEEYRLEKYDLGGLLSETRPLELNNNTRFIDARSQAAKTVINEVIDEAIRPEQRGGRAILVSLLNLGKLNYFHKKTATGDQALGLAASVLRKELSNSLVPFKTNGSDFFILSVGMNKEELIKYKLNLEEKLNASSEVDQVFLSEIEYVERTETDADARRRRIEEIRSLMAKKFQVH